ncbi:MAG: hypothetical protein ACI8TA_002718 [Cyclobacteriaceae bacterium]|jgi:hypothetical protein
MLVFLDYLFTAFHTLLVLFVLFGWIFPKTRTAHLILLGLVLFAWVGLGLYKGVLGYCPLTDWHWDIKRSLGERNIPSSFIEYMAEKITGIDFPRKLVDGFTLGGLILSIVMAVFMLLKSKFKRQ